MNIMDTDEKQRQKKIKEAMLAAKYMPYLALLFLILIVNQLIRSAGHWGVEIVLRTAGHIGGVMYCLSHWHKARHTLRGETGTPLFACLLLGILLMVSCPSMADMYHHKQMALFQTFAFAVAVVSLPSLGLIIWEISDLLRRKPGAQKHKTSST